MVVRQTSTFSISKKELPHYFEGSSFCFVILLFYFQCSHGVQDCDYGYSYIGKDGFPHIGHTEGSQDEDQNFDTEGKDDILTKT